jgi:transitional endoplasmic reticulum ATPase
MSRETCVQTPEDLARVYQRMVGRAVVRLALSADRCLRKVAEDSREANLVRELIGLQRCTGQLSRKRAAELLRSRLVALDAQAAGEDATPLMRNIALLAKLVDLNPIEQQLLAFMVWLKTSRELREVAGEVYCCNTTQAAGLLAPIMAVGCEVLKSAFDRSAALIDSGLLMVIDGLTNLSEKVMLRDGLEDVLLEERATEATLVGNFFDGTDEGMLTAADFQHLSNEFRLVSDYLYGAFDKRLVGVNILLYGLPGTGKTEFAKVLARSVGKKLYAVRNADVDGDPASVTQRLSSYRLCQRFLVRSRAGVVLFDEIEDVFPLVASDERRVSKAWLNSTLEKNTIPAIWISNSIEQVDAAYLRRFDYSVRFGSVSKAARERVLQKHLGGLAIADVVLGKLASRTDITAAQIERAGKVARTIRVPDEVVGRVVSRVIGRSAELLGQSVVESKGAEDGEYDLSLVNTDTNPEHLVSRLKNVSVPVALCLYGAPGTGKTAFAHHIAYTLDRPLQLQRASDLLSPWVGVVEQQIARMFERAEEEGAVLFLDEADGLLADRSHAKHSWEITQVNELLSRMEQFKGIFICATNLLDWFDEAAYRRFVLKIRFDYLTIVQKRELLRRKYPEVSQRERAECLVRLEGIRNLAIGDVATVSRRSVVMGERLLPREFVAQLKAECGFKRDQPRRSIGFSA